MSIEKIKTTIAALIAKAQGTDNEHEAELFMGKALELLEKHQLDLGDLQDAGDPVAVNKGKRRGWVASWETSLFSSVARLYGCRVVRMNGFQTVQQDLVGRESARVTVELMFPFIRGEVMRLGKALAKDAPHMTTAQHQRAVGNALILRINKLVRDNEPKDDAPKSVVANALVTKDRMDVVIAEEYGELSAGRKSTINTTGTARSAAASIGLHRQAGASSTLALK